LRAWRPFDGLGATIILERERVRLGFEVGRRVRRVWAASGGAVGVMGFGFQVIGDRFWVLGLRFLGRFKVSGKKIVPIVRAPDGGSRFNVQKFNV